MKLWRIPSLAFNFPVLSLNCHPLLVCASATTGIFPSQIVRKMFADFASDLILKSRFETVFKPRAHGFDYHINLVPSVFSTVTRNPDCGFLEWNGQTLASIQNVPRISRWTNDNIRDRRIETPRPLSCRWLKRFLTRANETEKLVFMTQDNAVRDFEIYTTSNQ